MRLPLLSFCVFITAISVPALPALAKNPSPQKLMDMAARCTYVTSVAEGSNVNLNYGTAEWTNLIRILEQKTGLDGEASLTRAEAKYNKRARVMGADEAYNYMLSMAKDCDREMAVIQS